MADDLTKPLLGTGRQRKGLTPFGILLTVLAAALAGVAIWVMIEAGPKFTAPDEAGQATAQADSTAAGEVVIRAAENQQSGVVITTPDGARLTPDGQAATPQPVALAPAPDPALLESGPYGPLPHIAANGVRPFDAYAGPAPAVSVGQPRIAIIVGGIGINQAGSDLALQRLPAAVSLALAPYGDNLAGWASQARQAGHELLLQIPMEPIDYPTTDPGAQTLIADDAAADNVDRLHWLLAQATSYAGVVSYAGGRFLTSADAMTPVIDELTARGLMFVDDGSVRQSQSANVATGALPFAQADMVLDGEISATAIAAKLDELVAIAQQRGYAIASASAFPVTIEQIAQWAQTLAGKGVVLVPVTSLANDPLTDATQVRLE